MKYFWGYFVMCIIFFTSAYFSFQQKVTKNEIIKSGKILKAVIIKMPSSCIQSIRQKNYCEIIGENQKQYKLQLNYNDCTNLHAGDTVQIREKDGIDEILRYNASVTTSSFQSELALVFFAILCMIAGVYNLKKSAN